MRLTHNGNTINQHIEPLKRSEPLQRKPVTLPRAARRRRYGAGVLSAIHILLCFAMLCACSPSSGQTPTQNYALPETSAGLIQASDGNYYAVGADSIYRTTPAGVVTTIFQITNSATQGSGLQPLVQGPDGALYGVTQKGGPNACNAGTSSYQMENCGVFYKINLDGSGYTVLHSFTSTEVGTGLLTGALVLAGDGNFYGTGKGGETNSGGNTGVVFRVSPAGSASLVYAFTLADDDAPLGGLIQGTDGFLHGNSQRNRNAGGYPLTVDKDNGHIFKLSLSGQIDNGYVLPADFSLGFPLLGTPVEGPDGTLYAAVSDGPSPTYYGEIVAGPPNGALRLLYTFGITGINASLAFAGDGNIYGGAYEYNAAGTCTATDYYCGVEFQLTPTGNYTPLHAFVDTSTGTAPSSNVLPASNGDLLGTAYNSTATNRYAGVVFDLATALPAPVQLAFAQNGTSPTSVTGGTQLTLSWKVLNAFSLSMQQCFAFPPSQLAVGSTQAAGWTGQQFGTYANAVLSGSATITAPAANGTYVYALTCGGVEAGQATLTVNDTIQITTTSLPKATVSTSYNSGFQATGGTLPYQYGYSGTFPAGLQIDPNTGFITGKPTQFGVYQVTVGVQDYSTPKLTAATTLQLTIVSGLSLAASLPNGTVATAYNSTATATGGLAPYHWALSTGALPTGLTLNPNNGAITGTPTAAGTFTFSIMVTDGEGKPATYTRSYTVSTVVPPLAIDEGLLFNCTVNVACQAQFTATGGLPPYTWTIAPSKTFPAGLTLNSNGSVSGKPTQYSAAGPYDLPVQVTDSENPPVQESGLNQLKVVSGLHILTVPTLNATIGLPFQSQAPTASGGLPPYTWKALISNAVLKEYSLDPATGIIASNGPITAGAYSVTFYLSDSETNPDTTSMTTTLTVSSPTVTSTTTLSSSSVTAGTGMGVVLTAKVSATSGAATGSVTFFNGSTAIGTAMLDNTQTATLSTTFTTAGVYAITATYAGAGAVTGSTSAPLTETVVTPSVSASFNPASLTLTAGQSGTLNLTLTPTGGYTGTVTFSCGSLPAHVSCSFVPQSLTIAAGATTVTDVLTIRTADTAMAATGDPVGPKQPALLWALGMFPALLYFGKARRKSWRKGLPKLLALGLVFIAVGSLLGCGGANAGTVAKPGSYVVDVALQLSTGSNQNQNLTINVQ